MAALGVRGVNSGWTQALAGWATGLVRDYGAVQNDATMESLNRFRWAIWVMIPLHMFFAWEFGQYRIHAGQEAWTTWSRTISLSHEVMAMVLMIIGTFIILYVPANRPAKALAYALQMALTGGYLVLGAVLTLADLRVGAGAGIATYLLASIVISVVSLIRPEIYLPLFFVVYAFFDHALRRLGLDAVQLDGVRLLSMSVPVMSAVASWTVWQQYVKATLLQRQLSARNAELQYLAQHDMLTGLFNRRHFTHEAQAELARAARAHRPTSILIADVDFFKKINDRYGHPVGDAVLQQVAKIFSDCVRTTDVVARLGGEEFIVLMPNTGQAGAMALAQKLRAALELHPLQVAPHVIPVTMSVGVSELAAGCSGAFEAVYAAADQALYSAKALGRNRVEWGVLLAPAAPQHYHGPQ
ncbi:MAG: GGDEF domain-containing protein [Burkholderiales bacterium]|nr:GGDEF domain-containing protein [Burkholderiales bacterium]